MVKRDERGRVMKGSTLNPKGRPPIDNSWAGIIREVMGMNAETLATEMGGNTNELGHALLKLPRGVPIKRLLAARLIAALMFDPTPGLVNALMDREEGKVAQPVDIKAKVSKVVIEHVHRNDNGK